MPDTTHPASADGDRPPQTPSLFLDVVYPLVISTATAEHALEVSSAAQDGDRPAAIEAFGLVRQAVAQLCDSRMAEQWPQTAADTAARQALERYAMVRLGESSSVLVAEALAALQGALRELLAVTVEGPEPGPAVTA